MRLRRLAKTITGSGRREPPASGLFDEIEALSEKQRTTHDLASARQLLRLRHLAGRRMLEAPADDPAPNGASDLPPSTASGFPEVTGSGATPGALGSAIQSHGCLVIRSLISRDEARGLAGQVESIFEAADQDRLEAPHYETFTPEAEAAALFERSWVREAGVIWLADTPMLAAEVLDAYERAGLRQLLTGYLGGRPLISVNKTGLRRGSPDVAPTWHQDGAFMGKVRTANVWLALTPCGQDAPGLAFVPRRLDGILPTGTDGAAFDWSVSPAVAEEAADGGEIARPIFEPGDAVVFDDLFLHAPGSSPGMTKTRYALESWFFAASGFPPDYVPLAF